MITKPHLAHLGLPLLAASTFVFPVAVPSAAALVAIGDHANLLFNGSVTARANDNIFLESEDEESDVIFIVAPGLELNVGSRANANVNLYFREDFYNYADNSDLDDNYSNAFLSAYLDQARLDLQLDADYQELAQPSPNDIVIPGQLIERDSYGADVRAEYDISEKTSAAIGVDSSYVDYENDVFSDRDVIGVPVDFYYELTPLVDLSVGYRYRHTDTSNRTNLFGGGEVEVPDYQDHFFNVGARGELAPKLLGEARIGYQERELDGTADDGETESGLSFGIDFSHYTTAKTTLTAGLFRDFETGGRGSAITAQGIDLGVNHSFSHLISAQAGIGYSEREWDRPTAGVGEREDERFDANVGVTYAPTQYLDLMASYVFRTNDSTTEDLDYDNNILSLSAALRY